jgi:hypothetical protein
MIPNPEVFDLMAASFPRDARLWRGCQVGGRSAQAAMLLMSSGYTDVHNVRGGVAGSHDPMTGRVVAAAWVDPGLPVEVGAPPGSTYADLHAKMGER